MSEVFTFVDASHLIAKATLWKERDKAIKKKYDTLNNEVLPKVALDKQARMGCKGKDNCWHGDKQPMGIDRQSGLINKVAVTPANVTDGRALKPVCPNQAGLYADKAYAIKPAQQAAASKGCHLAVIKPINRRDKNKALDRWYSQLRFPNTRVFSKRHPRVRYRGGGSAGKSDCRQYPLSAGDILPLWVVTIYVVLKKRVDIEKLVHYLAEKLDEAL